jgi:PAS domain S-box-containing protein
MHGSFVTLLYVTAISSAVLAGVAWRKRTEPGGTPMVIFHLALAVGAASYARDITATTLPAQVPLTMLSAVAQGVTAIAWLFAALQYAGFDRKRSRQLVGLLALEPVILGVGFLAPSVSILKWPASGQPGSLLQATETTLTPLFLIHTMVIVLSALVGTILLVRLFLRSQHLYRSQSVAVLVAALTPWTVGLTQNFFIDLPEDASIFAWGVSGAALTVGLYRFKKLDPVPAAQTAIVEDMGDGTVVVDIDGTISDANPAARQLLGVDGESLVGHRIGAVIDGWGDLDHDSLGPDEWRELPLTVDGEQRYVEVEVSSFTDRFDSAVGQLVVLRDVTRRKGREQRLAQYKTIFDSVNEPVYVLDDRDHFIRYNASFSDLVGYDETALVGQPFAVVLGTDDESVDRAADGRTEVTITTASGEAVPCEADLAPVELADGGTGRVGIIRDISERKEMESALAETTERLETLVQASPLAIVAHDLDGVVDVWNPAAESLFGWTAEEVRGEALPIVPDDREAELQERHRAVQSGERLTGYETELQCKDGTRVPVSVSAAPLSDMNGRVVGIVSIIADISDQKAKQRRLERQNERLDEFASLVSHDLRNPLQVASGNLEMAERDADDATRQYVEAAEDALDRMETLIDDTLALARQGQDISEVQQADIGTIARRAWDTVRTDGHDLDVADSPTVECDPDRVVELFENLFRNAVEHGSTSPRPQAPEDPVEHGGVENTDAVTVTVGTTEDGFYVADDGVGIPEDERATVFESGYTTATDGTGFGLAIVRTIADAHDWEVTVDESEDGGARFDVSVS